MDKIEILMEFLDAFKFVMYALGAWMISCILQDWF